MLHACRCLAAHGSTAVGFALIGRRRRKATQERWTVYTTSDMAQMPMVFKRGEHYASLPQVREALPVSVVLATVIHDESCLQDGGRLWELERDLERMEGEQPLRMVATYLQQGVRKFVLYCAADHPVDQMLAELRGRHLTVEIIAKVEEDPDWANYAEATPHHPLVSWPDMDSIEVREEVYRLRLEQIEGVRPGFSEAYERLRSEVLAHGGDSVFVPPGGDLALELAAADGSLQPIDGLSVIRMGDASSDLVRTLWERGRAVAIGIGVALDDDDVWWPHEWGWGADGRMLEPFRAFRKYYGVRLDHDAAAQFFAELDGEAG